MALTKIPGSGIKANSVTPAALVAIAAKVTRVVGDDYTDLSTITPYAATTYASTDGAPMVLGINPTNQQFWQ